MLRMIVLFFRSEEGAELLEWTVFVAILLTGIAVTISALGNSVTDLLNSIWNIVSDISDGLFS